MNRRIKELRKKLGLTLEKFGERLGVKKAAVSKWENGDNITSQMFKSICREFNVNEEWLRTGKGEMLVSNTGNELDALVKKYNLSQGVYIFIEKLINSQPETQNAIVEFVKDAGSILSTDDVLTNADTSSKTDMRKPSINEHVEVFRRQLKAEEKAAQGSWNDPMPRPARSYQ